MSWRILALFLLFASGCSENELHAIKDEPEDGFPRIEVEPNSVDFGVVPAGDQSVQVVSMRSTGDLVLSVTAMQIDAGHETFTLMEALPGRYEPGDSIDLTITYTSDGSETTGDLQILSNDPDYPVLSVPLLASSENRTDTGETGEEIYSQPVAVCSVSPTEVLAIHETASWLGSDSYDTDGGTIVSYDWTLVSSPAGATATMPAGDANRHRFAPDVAGEYVAELVVTDDDGIMSEPCDATLVATAGDGLWIEMFWTHSGDDMDLHLLDDGGTLTTATDCYYGNCTYGGLDWGARGDSTDDPVLDLDDISGVGPENINIESPARGTYTVYVHDYPGSSYVGRNDVTVNIYWGGVLEWTDTRNINAENCYEPFATIDAPSGTVTDLAGSCR